MDAIQSEYKNIRVCSRSFAVELVVLNDEAHRGYFINGPNRDILRVVRHFKPLTGVIAMSYGTLDETEIKKLFKQALVELLQERRDLLYDVVAEIVEDIALLRAIKEGEETDTVHRSGHGYLYSIPTPQGSL